MTPGDFTVHSVPGLLDGYEAWAGELPAPQALAADLVEEGRAIPVARVQAMHEGKRRKRAREAQGLGGVRGLAGVPALADLLPAGRRAGQLAAPGGPHAVEDERQVTPPEFGGPGGVGELDRGHQLE